MHANSASVPHGSSCFDPLQNYLSVSQNVFYDPKERSIGVPKGEKALGSHRLGNAGLNRLGTGRP